MPQSHATAAARVHRDRLLAAAREVMQNAYAPYSNFRVGAALLSERGNLYAGCNVENASYGLTICAERSAVSAAVAAEGPQVRISAMAVVNGNNAPCSPCGACRQVIFEFGPDALVWFSAADGVSEATARELLPHGFEL